MTEYWTEIAAEWSISDIGAPLLGSLAEGLYDAREVLREYVQNAVDAYVDFRQLTGREPQYTVQVLIDPDVAEVHIMDRGVGMDLEDILGAKSIAVSHKLERPNEFVGFRGIGIWSGLSACDALILETTKVHVPFVYQLTIDFKSIVEHVYEPIPIDQLLQGRFHIHQREGDPEEYYTRVRLVNVHRDRYGALLDVEEMKRYASQYLPVPFDPEWPYTKNLKELLAAVASTSTYELAINGEPVYRIFPSETEIKKPEQRVIFDDNGKEVAVAWFAETNRRGQRKAIEVDYEKGEVNNFAIRIKNFTVGPRGLYATPQDVLDCDNLSWYLGEIYITDTDIKPDTNRRSFQHSFHSTDVIKAIQRFYTTIATSARGWSEEVTAIAISEVIEIKANQVEKLLSEGKNSGELVTHWDLLLEYRQKLIDAQAKANSMDVSEDSPRVLAVRRYLRKPNVKEAINRGLGIFATIEQRLKAIKSPQGSPVVTESPTLSSVMTEPSSSSSGRRKRSSARTATLGGNPITASAALSTQAVAGISTDLKQPSLYSEGNGQQIDLNLAINAFLATVAAVLGGESDAYRQISERLPEELRRRGIDV